MNREKRARPEPIVTYRPRLNMTTNVTRYSEIEKQCIQVICDRDEYIARLEYALKEVKRILVEEPEEIGTARRIIENALRTEEL